MVKFIAIFFIAAAFSVGYNDASIITSLQNQAQTAINNFVNTSQNAINNAGQTANSLLLAAVNVTGQVENNLQHVISDAFGEANKTVAAAIAEVQKLGGKAEVCLQGYQSNITNFTTSELIYMARCISDPVSQAISLAQDLVTQATSLASLVTQFNSTITSTCGSKTGFDQTACLLGVVLTDAEVAAVSISKIAVDVTQAATLVSSLTTIQVTLPTCLAQKAVQVAIDAIPLAAAIVKCTVTS